MSKATAPGALRLAFALGLVAVGAAGACGNDHPPPPHGSPVLLRVYWVAGGTPLLIWSLDPNNQLQTAVQPLGTEIDFVFDRRLDGDRIEDTFTDGGVTTTRPKAVPPIRATWPGMADMPGDPPFALTVSYNSAPRFGSDTSYVFARPIEPGFPSSETVTFQLDVDALTSEYGEPATVPDGGVVAKTTAFAVRLGAPEFPVTTSFKMPMEFSNRVASAAQASPFVQVTLNNVVVPSKLIADASDSARFYVGPADCLGAWPANANLVVAVAAGIEDAFGRVLTKGMLADFVTEAAGSSQPDASCPLAPGGVDAGVDAAVDGSVDAADAADASVEGSAED